MQLRGPDVASLLTDCTTGRKRLWRRQVTGQSFCFLSPLHSRRPIMHASEPLSIKTDLSLFCIFCDSSPLFLGPVFRLALLRPRPFPMSSLDPSSTSLSDVTDEGLASTIHATVSPRGGAAASVARSQSASLPVPLPCGLIHPGLQRERCWLVMV